jgi:hypothetical protein
MKTKLMALMLVAGGALFAETHVAIGVQIGRPAPVLVPAPVPVNAYRPPYPGPGYVWIDGYYDEYGNWFDGYWALPPYAGAYWIAPRHDAGRFYAGYWGGPRGIYRPEPRYAAPAYERHERGFVRPAPAPPERYGHNDRGRGNWPDRGRGGDFRQGYRR